MARISSEVDESRIIKQSAYLYPKLTTLPLLKLRMPHGFLFKDKGQIQAAQAQVELIFGLEKHRIIEWLYSISSFLKVSKQFHMLLSAPLK